jgi:hypothetical protein
MRCARSLNKIHPQMFTLFSHRQLAKSGAKLIGSQKPRRQIAKLVGFDPDFHFACGPQAKRFPKNRE